MVTLAQSQLKEIILSAMGAAVAGWRPPAQPVPAGMRHRRPHTRFVFQCRHGVRKAFRKSPRNIAEIPKNTTGGLYGFV